MEIYSPDMSEGAAERSSSPSTQLSADPSLDGLPAAEDMPETQTEDGRTSGLMGLAAPCCVCLEAERLRGCLNSEKICIVPILACLVSLCLCIAGLKWVFVDKIFEYDSPTHLDPGGLGQDPIISLDPTAASAVWVASEAYTSPVSRAQSETEVQVTVQVDNAVVSSEPSAVPTPKNRIFAFSFLPSTAASFPFPTRNPEVRTPKSATQPQTTETNLQTAPKLSTSTSTTGTSHLVKCAEKEKTFCVNGGECFMVKDLSNPSRYLCKCQPGFTGARCTENVPMKVQNQEKAEELYQKRVLTITGICIALLVVGIMCVVAYCKTKKQRKKLHDRLRQSLRSERNNMVNIANGPHHPNPPPENVQLVNQYVSKNVISSEHIVEREAETSFSTSHYTSTAHHSTTVTQTPSHSWSNGHTESIISESHSVIMMSSVENSRHSSPSGGPRGRLNGVGGPRECNSFLRHARETPDSYRDSPHSERYVSAMTTPARMSPVDFHTPSSPKSPPSEMSPPVSGTTVSMPSMAVSPFVEEERPLLLVTPPRLREKYDRHPPQFTSYHHNPAHESNSLPPSPLRIVEDEEYETTQEYEPAQEPVKKLTSSRRPKRTKPNGHIANRLEMDSNASAEGTHSESETEDERVGEDTPFLGIQNPLAASLEAAPAFRLADSRTNPAGRFSPQEELQARLTSVIANQDPIAV
ncbi:pro-neuregulin-1, membrane-bound isoform isoform X2 [Panthera pardus]|uniref:Pro-neuregulin-1, membrane-bound isoform n=1 Tax=Panthera pardus TaxID=9691 RepID=A0A9W2VEE8_PANPR|nr:pro-neuregulin-1, membrane-bound isoform isoform X3 [Panthera tigris]XP_019683936.2 pro-neuregulin-1, membrane-bound isoform isoform X6 [Felis catus]XP_030168177.1 pro-neuregulin-1, membrane-bound isoform isoform X3 [Lynx canadensis]XP_042790418.1 pro-neuregulin-1, membrane-bound isoform isoform X3 [Panthera leo]XP_045312209.1 pro-neuregulin-1, membrane-bound isoform isoform X6 [Leopardus geoffroyi]XP_046946494.1 pro-neuregulin-1, membrane-bound isoform isoform X1 [Lynx rufus]XP_047713098.